MAKHGQKTLGFGDDGQVSSPGRGGRLVVATDGSCDQVRVGTGYVSSEGHYGLRGHPYPDDLARQHRVVVTELRAVFFALDVLLRGDLRRRPVRVLLDSEEALSLLRDWREGGERMPEGYGRTWRYSGQTPTLVLLHELVARTPTLSFRHQRGHVGHPLNETADSLAKLGLRVSKGNVGRDVARQLAAQWAAQSAASFAALSS